MCVYYKCAEVENTFNCVYYIIMINYSFGKWVINELYYIIFIIDNTHEHLNNLY